LFFESSSLTDLIIKNNAMASAAPIIMAVMSPIKQQQVPEHDVTHLRL
jgi:hypothetical protein